MKSNKGVTLISLTIYIILFTIIVAILGSITGYFMKNLDEISVTENSEESFNRVLMFVNNDLNNKDLIYINAGQEKDQDDVILRDYLVFKFGNNTEHQYIVERVENDNTLYFFSIEDSNSQNSNYEKIITLSKNVTDNTEDEIFKYKNNKLEIKMKINGKLFSAYLNTTLIN